MGITPLHRAARATASPAITLLLQHGADVNAADETLQTPLHLAAGPNSRPPSAETINPLLEGGAEVNAKDQEGNTPLHMAARSAQLSGNPLELEVIMLLLKEGADIAAANNDGLTACDVGPSDDESIRELLCP